MITFNSAHFVAAVFTVDALSGAGSCVRSGSDCRRLAGWITFNQMNKLHYPNPPITEAIIDLRAVLAPEVQISDIERLCSEEKATYPRQDKLFEAHGRIELQPGIAASTSTEHRQTGLKLTSDDGLYVWQPSLEGMGFSRLAPYESWEPFSREARRLWTKYKSILTPAVVRVAVRYVNRIDMPAAERVELKDYLRTVPEVSSNVIQPLNGFLMQLHVAQPDLEGQVLITEASTVPGKEASVSVILDIDLFRSESIPSDDEALWDLFERLHIRKNEIFQACITERAEELFK